MLWCHHKDFFLAFTNAQWHNMISAQSLLEELMSIPLCSMRIFVNPYYVHTTVVHISSSSTDRCSPGINLKMCLRTLALLLLRGRVPNRVEILVSSQEAERELLLPARLELLVRQRDSGWWLPQENVPEASCDAKSPEKKQLSSEVLAALKGLGELRSPNTLAWSLSSVMMLL